MTTDSKGDYRLEALPPGEYTIVAELSGFERTSQRNVDVHAGGNLRVDLAMSVGAVTETIEVTREAPLLESRNAVQSVNVSGDLLRALPLSERREWFGALELAPGVTMGLWVNSQPLIFVHGANSSDNIIQVDGADMSASLTSGPEYLSLNTDSIDDIQIKTAGVDASAPLGLGGVINIATASGTNHVKGAATLFVQPLAWNGSNTPGGTSSTVDQKQVDLSLGAPIVKDRLWAFGSYRHVDANTGVSRTADQIQTLDTLAPGITLLENTNNANFSFVKLNTLLSPAHQLEGFYQYDINPVTYVDGMTQYARSEATGGSGASARFSSVWSDHVTTRLGVSFNDKRRDGRDPQIPGPTRLVYQSTILSAGRLVGNGRLVTLGSPVTAWNLQPDSKLTVSFDSTVFLNGGGGSHELQTGIYAQPRIHIENATEYINGGNVLEEDVLRVPNVLTSGVIPFHRIVYDSTGYTNTDRAGQDYAVYVQDAWRPNPRLTVNAGVRIDHIVWKDLLFGVTPQRSTEIGPRLGINYALTSDTRNVVRAHWVRVHDQPSQTATSAGTVSATQHSIYALNLDGIFNTDFVTPGTLTLTPTRTLDPSFHQPYAEEWGVGYDKQLTGRFTAAVDLVRRDYRDRPTLLDTNGIYNGNVFVGYSNPAFNEIYELTNNRWNTPIFTSLELSLTKRTQNIQAIASYVRQWRHLDGTWQPNDPASFIQPSAFANNRGIGSPTGSISSPDDSNSLSGLNMTQPATASTQWQDHTVRAGVTYRAPWQLLLATTYTFQSGAWIGPIISQIAAPDPTFGPTVVTLSNGRNVTNPLATTLRFAYPTRSDGQFATPTLHVWNARVGRGFVVNRFKFEASLDVFNITNNGADESFIAGANDTFSPVYGSTQYRQLPRSAQAVFRMSF